MKLQRRLSLALAWLVLIIAPLPLIVILNRGIIDTAAHVTAYDFGVVAYVWWLMIVLLSTRPRWLERRIGMPAIYAIHGALAVMALIAATIHRFYSFSLFPLIKETGNIAWYLEIVMILYAVLFLSGWLTDRIAPVKAMKTFLERHGFKHQLTMWLHRLNFVAIALIWLHVQLIPRLALVPGFRIMIDVYTAIALLVYLAWKVRQQSGERAVVVANQAVDDSLQVLTLELQNPRHHYQAGDFYFLSFRSKGFTWESHPFSVASAPEQAADKVTFTIHRVGDDTSLLNRIPTGSQVRLEGPFGLFDQDVRSSKGPLILYGLGSGVAPLLSLARQYAGQGDLHLLWSGPQVNDRYYQQQLTDLKRDGVKVDAQVHRFSHSQLSEVLSEKEIAEGRVIIVGSARKVLLVRKSLRQLGFHRNQLLDERMTL